MSTTTTVRKYFYCEHCRQEVRITSKRGRRNAKLKKKHLRKCCTVRQ